MFVVLFLRWSFFFPFLFFLRYNANGDVTRAQEWEEAEGKKWRKKSETRKLYSTSAMLRLLFTACCPLPPLHFEWFFVVVVVVAAKQWKWNESSIEILSTHKVLFIYTRKKEKRKCIAIINEFSLMNLYIDTFELAACVQINFKFNRRMLNQSPISFE